MYTGGVEGMEVTGSALSAEGTESSNSLPLCLRLRNLKLPKSNVPAPCTVPSMHLQMRFNGVGEAEAVGLPLSAQLMRPAHVLLRRCAAVS